MGYTCGGVGEMRNVGRPEEKRRYFRDLDRREDNIEMEVEEMLFQNVGYIHLS
jgi:hypothetical protein